MLVTPLVIDTWPESRSPAELFFRLPPKPGRFLLESQGGPEDVARYSFFGGRPFAGLAATGKNVTIWGTDTAPSQDVDPLRAVENILARYPVISDSTLPPFTGGAVGYLAYDLGRQFERLPATARSDLALPDLRLDFYDHLVAIDHQTQQASVIALPLPGRETKAIARANALAMLIRQQSAQTGPVSVPNSTGALESNFTRATYCGAIQRALDYIRAGQIYQVNLAQRFSSPFSADTSDSLYLSLRAANPAPFAAFLDYGAEQLISASPERFLHFDPLTRRVETRPIKGTRPRGGTPPADAQLRAELTASEKEAAELVMIVDLERNDLGRVCDYGSVIVPDLRRVEAYPTVWHTVATVAGTLRSGASRADLLRAAFPGGSITGAPKIRAMQIIEELEGLRRNVYCGGIGYLGFDGRMDLNIAIRTITLAGGRAYFHAGGGIVADSDPDAEYDETLHKARALAGSLGADISPLYRHG